jgi:hypothetical protein
LKKIAVRAQLYIFGKTYSKFIRFGYDFCSLELVIFQVKAGIEGDLTSADRQ